MSHWSDYPYRSEAVSFDLKNGGSLLFCFDEAQRRATKKSLWGGDSGTSSRTIAELKGKNFFAQFREIREMMIRGLVSLGPPPTPEELPPGKWKPSQSVSLSVPSGQLRLETLESFSLVLDHVDKDALMIEVPPGDYLLTLVERADDSSSASDSDQATSILMTLTPENPEFLIPEGFQISARPATPRFIKKSVLRKYFTHDGRFFGRMRRGKTNFDRRALRLLDVQFGEALRITTPEKTMDAWYVDALDPEHVLQLVDPAFLAQCDAFARWVYHHDDWRVLWIINPGDEALELAPLSNVEISKPGFPPLPLSRTPGKWSRTKENVLHGQVLSCSPTVLTVNLGRDALALIHAKPNDVLRLTINGETRPLRLLQEKFLEDPVILINNWRFDLFMQFGDQRLKWLLQLKHFLNLGDDVVSDPKTSQELWVDPAKLLAAATDDHVTKLYAHILKQVKADLAASGQLINVTPRAFGTPPVMCGTPYPFWGDAKDTILWIESEAFVRDYNTRSAMWKQAVPHGFSLSPGAEVTVSRES